MIDQTKSHETLCYKISYKQWESTYSMIKPSKENRVQWPKSYPLSQKAILIPLLPSQIHYILKLFVLQFPHL